MSNGGGSSGGSGSITRIETECEGGSTPTVTFNTPTTAGELIVVDAAVGNGGGIDGGITDNGSGGSSVYTSIANSSGLFGGVFAVDFYYAYNVKAGITQITLNPGTGNANLHSGLCASHYMGIATSNPLDIVKPFLLNQGSPFASTATGVLSQSNELVVGSVANTWNQCGATFTATNGFTQDGYWSTCSGTEGAIADLITTSNASVAYGGTSSYASQNNVAIATFRGASGTSTSTPPTTSITAPANNATVSGTITVTATASDNVGVTQVQLYVDGALASTDAASPYTFSLNTNSLANGTHTLMTKAYDAAGNVGSSANVSVTVSNVVVTPPTITSSLSSSATIGSAFTYQITGSNSPTSYGASGLPAGLSMNTSSGVISGTPAVTSAGTYSVTLSATNSGGTGTATLTLTVSNAPDTTPPTIPTNLSIVNITTSSISLAWTVSTDPTVTGQVTSGLAGYKIYRGGIQVGTSTTGSFTNTGLTASTTYSYTVSAYDNAGNVSAPSSAVNATTGSPADTTPPTTSITAPANNATVSGTITVTATASDNVGVTQVQLYVDGALASTDAASPYTFSLNTNSLANGTHTLMTKAYDAAGNVGSSANVSVTVSNAAQTLTASLTASPSSGNAPLTTSLTATAGGTAQGTINYIFYCNRTDTGTNITSPADLTVNAVDYESLSCIQCLQLSNRRHLYHESDHRRGERPSRPGTTGNHRFRILNRPPRLPSSQA